jgi:hypothetical protein
LPGIKCRRLSAKYQSPRKISGYSSGVLSYGDVIKIWNVGAEGVSNAEFQRNGIFYVDGICLYFSNEGRFRKRRYVIVHTERAEKPQGPQPEGRKGIFNGVLPDPGDYGQTINGDSLGSVRGA